MDKPIEFAVYVLLDNTSDKTTLGCWSGKRNCFIDFETLEPFNATHWWLKPRKDNELDLLS